MIPINNLPDYLLHDLARLICAETLGKGIGRQVYVLGTDSTKVIKLETAARSFQNAMEWEVWDELKSTRHAKYLAPCHWISECGMVLIQSRVQPLRPEHEKVQLPSFLTDFKRTNYGILNGRVVACDYGYTTLVERGANASRKRKPEWWDL